MPQLHDCVDFLRSAHGLVCILLKGTEQRGTHAIAFIATIILLSLTRCRLLFN